ncbi:MAG: hypothetical protein AAGN35_16090 [Bacteroidota bacterium]
MKTPQKTSEKQPPASTAPKASAQSARGTAQFEDNRPGEVHQLKLRAGMQNSAAAPPSLPREGRKGSHRFRQIATAMGQKYGVDTSGIAATHNSSFPARVNAEATIQKQSIHFAPGKDTDFNMKHEVAHAIDNALHGTPRGNAIANGYKIDTTREKVADRMAREPLVPRPPEKAPRGKALSTHHGEVVQRRPYAEEENILGSMNQGDLTPANVQAMLDLVNKKQSKTTARKIAAETETESAQLVAGLGPQALPNVRQQLLNYVAGSSAIQNDMRAGGNRGAPLVQVMQNIRGQMANAAQPRIVYRMSGYRVGDGGVPYGRQAAPAINVGDFVADQGFLSTSRHRQFVLGRENSQRVADTYLGMVNYVIKGTSGVNIAMDLGTVHEYSNRVKKMIKDGDYNSLVRAEKAKRIPNYFKMAMKKFESPAAGQAEILFEPNTQFEVMSIRRREGNNLTESDLQKYPNLTEIAEVVLEERPANGPVKDLFNGN